MKKFFKLLMLPLVAVAFMLNSCSSDEPNDGTPDFFVHYVDTDHSLDFFLYRPSMTTITNAIYLHIFNRNSIQLYNCELVGYGPIIERNDKEITIDLQHEISNGTSIPPELLDPDRGYVLKAKCEIKEGRNKGKELEIYYNIYFSGLEKTTFDGSDFYSNPKRLHFQRVR